MQYYKIVGSSNLYAYERGITVRFENGEWGLSPINVFVLEHMDCEREVVSVSRQDAMIFTDGKDPADFINAYLEYLGRSSYQD